MTQEQHEELEKIRRWKEEMDRRESQLLAELGEAVEDDIATKQNKEEKLSTLFDKLTPAERLEMYRTEPEQWQKMLEAKENAGLRQLFA